MRCHDGHGKDFCVGVRPFLGSSALCPIVKWLPVKRRKVESFDTLSLLAPESLSVMPF